MSGIIANKKVGRSIEEILVRRKYENNTPVTLPPENHVLKTTKMSQSVPTLKPLQDFSAPNASERPHVQIVRDIKTAETTKTEGSYLADYSEADKTKMIESLLRYTRTMQERMEFLESQVASMNLRSTGTSNSKFALSRNLSFNNPQDLYQAYGTAVTSRASTSNMHAHTSYNASYANSNNNSSQQARRGQANVVDGVQHAAVTQIMSDIDFKVFNLKEIFRKGDPIADRKRGAEIIGALVRGFLARQRLQKFKRGVREWRWVRCRPVTYIIDILLSIHSKRDAGFHLMKTNRTMKTLTIFFGKWSGVCRANAPMRRAVKKAAEAKIYEKKLILLRKVFEGLRQASVGDLSTRYANAVRRKLLDSIRHDLSEKYRSKGSHLGVVPEHEVQKVLHRRVLEQFTQRQKSLSLKYTYNGLKRNWETGRRFMKAAVHRHFAQLAGRCFYAWTDYTYLVARGLDRKRWPGPRKYEVKYNQKRVDNFARLRYQKAVFVAWKAYYGKQAIVKRKYQHKLAQFVKKVFSAWADVSGAQHRLRLIVYKSWKEYPRVMMIKPFEAWANHVKAVKNHDQEQLRICKAYVRWKWRQRVLTILKVWRHQALYGRIDGLYSRQMLLKTLAEQKFAANLLEKHMSDQTLELEECRTIVSKEVERRKALEEELRTCTAERDKNKMTNHHFEQELRRVQSVIDCMIELNPHQIKHIQKIQPDFRFKERNIVLSKEPSNEEKHAAAVAKAARRAEIMAEADAAKAALENAVASGTSAGGDGIGGGDGIAMNTLDNNNDNTNTVGSSDSVDELETRDTFSEHATLSNKLHPNTNNDAILDDEGEVIPMLAEIGTGLSTIVEMNDSESGVNTPITQRSFMREMPAPLLHTQKTGSVGTGVGIAGSSTNSATNSNANSRRGNFNDSSSTLGGEHEGEAEQGGEHSAQDSAQGSAIHSRANSGGIGGYGVGTNATTDTNNTASTTPAKPVLAHINTAHSPAVDTPHTPHTPHSEAGHYMSEEDRVLLLRVKWMLSRFHDSTAQAEREAHTKSSLELLKGYQDKEAQRQVAVQMALAESADAAKKAGTERGLMLPPPSASTDSLDDSPFPVLTRPTLLPVKTNNITDILRTEIDLVSGTTSSAAAGNGAKGGVPGAGGAGFGGSVYTGVGGHAGGGVHGHVRPTQAHHEAGLHIAGGADTHSAGTPGHVNLHLPAHINTHTVHTVPTAHPSRPTASGHGSVGSGESTSVTRENSDHFDVNHFPIPQSPSHFGSPGGHSGKHLSSVNNFNSLGGMNVVSASPVRTTSLGGLGSFSSNSGSRKHEDFVAEQTADLVQAALDAVHLAEGDNADSTKMPFEARERIERADRAPAPALKTQVRQLSRQFGNVMRQSSNLLYRSMRGSKQFAMARGNSTMSEAADSMFDPMYDENEDIPMVEIDEMDCLKNASVKILLSFIEFLEDGNVSSFQPEDRREWVKHLLAAAEVEETEEDKEIKEMARFAAERWHVGSNDEGDNQEHLLERIPAPMLGHIDRENTMKRLDSSSALITVDGAESAVSWRLRLMQLRALNSGAGNASGKTVPLDDDHEVSMFRRILEMRTKLEGIIQLQTIKYQRQLAIMLRNTKRGQEVHSSHSAGGLHTDSSDGSTGHDALNKKFGAFANSPFPSPIRTNVFTPSLAAVPSPHGAHFAGLGGSEYLGSESESPTNFNSNLPSGKVKSSKLSSKSSRAPRLGANIYAGNLKMMSSVEENEYAAQLAAAAPPDSP